MVRTAFLLLLWFVAFTARPGLAHAADLAAIDRAIRAELAATHTPGAAVAVIAEGRVVYAKGFGLANVDTGAKVTPTTLFRLGSTTKMLTAAALVALAQRGTIKLDAPIGAVASGLTPTLAKLTAHRLLSNSAGVADFAAPFVSHDDSALARMIRGWKDDALFGEPGRVYSYASPGFWLAGYVLEEASGKAYADAMRELVFTPAGMTRSTLRPLQAMTHALAVGHDVQGGEASVIRPAFDNVAMWPAGSAYSSADELAKFVLALLGGSSGLPPGLLDTLSGAYVAMPGEPGVHYGYGLMHFEDRGVRMVMHGGFSRGYGSMIQMAPAQRFAVIVVANTSGQTLPRTVEAIKKLFLERGPEVVVKKDPVALAAGDARKFVGVYVNAGQSWEIVERAGQLALRAEGEEVGLTRTGEWRLSYGAQLADDVAFVAGADGRAEYVFTGLYAGRRKPSVATPTSSAPR